MFERALLTKGRTRTPVGVVVGMTSELTAIGLAVLIPLIYTDRLPAFMTAATAIAIPSRAPDPPPPEAVAKAVERGGKVVKYTPTGVFTAPVRIPNRVNDAIIEEPIITASGPWVVGATGLAVGGPVGLPAAIAPAVAPPPPDRPSTPKQVAGEKTIERIRLGGVVQDAKVTTRIIPAYPTLARQARVQGTVSLVAVIGVDGRVKSLRVMSGHPLLVQAAVDAVRQWVYRPTMLNGAPVEVESPIDVHFTLGQ